MSLALDLAILEMNEVMRINNVYQRWFVKNLQSSIWIIYALCHEVVTY